jgi:hypothetical protein
MVGNIANSAPSWEDYNENSASRLNKREQAPPPLGARVGGINAAERVNQIQNGGGEPN